MPAKTFIAVFLFIALPFEQLFANQQDIIDSLLNRLNKSQEQEQIDILKQLAEYHLDKSSEKTLEYAKRLAQLSIQLNDKKSQAIALDQMGSAFYLISDYEQALDYYLKSLQISEDQKDTAAMSRSYNNIGVVYKKWGKYEEALDIQLKALKINENLNDSISIANSLSNIGSIYYYWENNEKAIEYFQKALKLYEMSGAELKVASMGNNIGSVYLEMEQYNKAIEFYNKALSVYEKQNIKLGIAIIRDNIGLAYIGLEEYDKAELYVKSSLQMQKEIGNQEGMIYGLNNLGTIHFKRGNFDQALNYYKQTLPISKALNLNSTLMDNYKAVYDIYYEQKDYKNALEYYLLYTALKDSLFNENKHNQIAELETRYQTEKKEKEIELLNAEKSLKESVIKRQQIINFTLIIGVIALFAIVFLVYTRFRLKKRANLLLRKQKLEIEKQRDEIRSINLEIRSSIEYANRIQNAVLQPTTDLKDVFADAFIFNVPRDIVSGDFYWFMQKNDRVLFTVADCTGHGVPGAFMSMLGMSLINEIVSNNHGLKASEFLNLLRNRVKKVLRQDGEVYLQKDENKVDKNKLAAVKDGMDLAFCIYHPAKKMLEYAGANNPLFIMRNKELVRYKADKMPVGVYLTEKESFTNHQIEVETGDCIYLFSDGYVDQFGGPSGNKFQTSRFKDLLMSIHHLNMAEQKKQIHKHFLDWKGDHIQIDDILIMGVRL